MKQSFKNALVVLPIVVALPACGTGEGKSSEEAFRPAKITSYGIDSNTGICFAKSAPVTKHRARLEVNINSVACTPAVLKRVDPKDLEILKSENITPVVNP